MSDLRARLFALRELECDPAQAVGSRAGARAGAARHGQAPAPSSRSDVRRQPRHRRTHDALLGDQLTQQSSVVMERLTLVSMIFLPLDGRHRLLRGELQLDDRPGRDPARFRGARDRRAGASVRPNGPVVVMGGVEAIGIRSRDHPTYRTSSTAPRMHRTISSPVPRAQPMTSVSGVAAAIRPPRSPRPRLAASLARPLSAAGPARRGDRQA
jgi:hypothetical protein